MSESVIAAEFIYELNNRFVEAHTEERIDNFVIEASQEGVDIRIFKGNLSYLKMFTWLEVDSLVAPKAIGRKVATEMLDELKQGIKLMQNPYAVAN